MKKNKKQNKVGKVFGVIFSIVMIAATMYLLFNIIKLNVLPTKLLFLMTIVFVLLDLIFILLLCFATKGVVSKIICIIFALAISLGFLFRWILYVKDWWTTFKYDECC